MKRVLILPILVLSGFFPYGFVPGTGARATTMQAMHCSSSIPAVSKISFPEVRGITTRGTLWALLFYAPPAKVGVTEKIVLRITGKGSIHVVGIGPGAERIRPAWGPERHGGSNWTRPGAEWGTGWTFTVAGCWHLHAKRSGASGNVWLQVT